MSSCIAVDLERQTSRSEESENGSSNGVLPVSDATEKNEIKVKRVRCSVDVMQTEHVVHTAVMLSAIIAAVTPTAPAGNTIHASTTAQTILLTDQSGLNIDAAGRMIVFDHCTFVASDPLARITVRSQTSCFFRMCTFQAATIAAAEQLVQCEDASATHRSSHCTFELNKTNGADVSSISNAISTTANVAVPNRAVAVDDRNCR